MKNTSGSLRRHLFWAFALVTLIAVSMPAYFSRKALYEERIHLAGQEALGQAAFARSILETSPTEAQTAKLFATAAELSFRMTLTAPGGAVIRDSHVGESSLPDLDNHADRPEIEEAYSRGSGISLRHSNTLGYDAVYAAVTLENGGILRVAIPLADIRKGLEKELLTLFVLIVGVCLFCLLLSAVITGKIRKRIDCMAEIVAAISRSTGKGNGHRRLRNVRWRELQPLAYAVNYMADTIEAYVAKTRDQHSQLETILDSMHEGVLVLGSNGHIRRWNRALARLFPEISQAEGKPLISGIPLPELQKRVDGLIARHNETQPAGDTEQENTDGNTATSSITNAPGYSDLAISVDTIDALHFEMPSGRFLVAHVSGPAAPNESLGAVIVVYDATELTRLERVRREFVSNVSHELRTPLTAIAGYAETLMASDDLNEEYRKFAGIIHKHAAALAKVTSDLLALARIENARESMDLRPVDAKPLIFDVAASIREQADPKAVSIQLDLEPATVLANSSLLAQVFRNLLENACRYSPHGGTVHVSSRREGKEVLFTVTDQGPGIPKQELPRIFERFYQVKKERNSGTAGIGLAICKHVIERHQGRIWAMSPYQDAATAMLFTLPAAPADK